MSSCQPVAAFNSRTAGLSSCAAVEGCVCCSWAPGWRPLIMSSGSGCELAGSDFGVHLCVWPAVGACYELLAL